MRPTFIDLFSGAGGMSLGFEQAGFEPVAAVEIDPIHAAAHEFNFPNCATIAKSVTEVTGDDLLALPALAGKSPDVVIGGAPCQGFSLIGQRALDDPRNSLVMDFVRIVRETRARFFVFENVKGLTVGKHKKFLDEIVSEFSVHRIPSPIEMAGTQRQRLWHPPKQAETYSDWRTRGRNAPQIPVSSRHHADLRRCVE